MYFKQTPVIRLKLLHLHTTFTPLHTFYLFKQVNVKLKSYIYKFYEKTKVWQRLKVKLAVFKDVLKSFPGVHAQKVSCKVETKSRQQKFHLATQGNLFFLWSIFLKFCFLKVVVI